MRDTPKTKEMEAIHDKHRDNKYSKMFSLGKFLNDTSHSKNSLI